MASPNFGVTGQPTLQQLVDYFVEKLADPETLRKFEHAMGNAVARGDAVGAGAMIDASAEWIGGKVAWLAAKYARVILGVLNAGEQVYNELAATATDSLLGEGMRHVSAPADSGRRVIDKITAGGGATIQPGIDGAANYLTLMLNEQFEAWTRGFIVELVSGIEVAGFTAGSVETFAKLEEIIEGALGGGRMIRRVLQPFMNATAITPATWHVNKQYSPELLSAAAAIEAHLAGRWTSEQLVEELARQGFSLERINVLVTNARKRLSFADLVEQFNRGAISDVDVLTRAGELGYDQGTARELLTLATARRRDRLKDPNVDAAVAAFVAGDIGEGELRSIVEANAPTLSDVPLIIDSARVRRGLRRQQLSPIDERRLAVKGIRAISDYRRALEREGFDPESVTALELELRMELADRADVAEAREAAAAERDAERVKAAEDRAAREADVAARKALPTLQEYRRAYVRGTIERQVFADAIARDKAAITPGDLALLLADADLDRDAWLEKQERAELARATPRDAALSVAQLEAAVLADILTLADFDAQIAGAGYDDDERRVLVELLSAKLEDQADTHARRAATAAAADVKGISLPQLERAVRLGLRTRADYVAVLERLNTPPISKALLLDLLDAAIAQDDATRQTRAERDPQAAAAGLSLAQRRRAVIAGVLPRADYEAALVAARWPNDDILAELALLDLETEQAAAARARRDQVTVDPAEPGLTLGQVERAVRLGLLPPSALRAWLEDRGYGASDVETIVALAVAAVPDVRAGQQLEQRVAGELARKGLSLGQLQTAARRGLRTLDDYAGELRAQGYGEDDVALLRQLLEEQLAVDVEGLRTKIRKALEGHDDAPPLEEIEAALRAGEIDVGELRELLGAFSVPNDVAIVFGRVVLSFGMEG